MAENLFFIASLLNLIKFYCDQVTILSHHPLSLFAIKISGIGELLLGAYFYPINYFRNIGEINDLLRVGAISI